MSILQYNIHLISNCLSRNIFFFNVFKFTNEKIQITKMTSALVLFLNTEHVYN